MAQCDRPSQLMYRHKFLEGGQALTHRWAQGWGAAVVFVRSRLGDCLRPSPHRARAQERISSSAPRRLSSKQNDPNPNKKSLIRKQSCKYVMKSLCLRALRALGLGSLRSLLKVWRLATSYDHAHHVRLGPVLELGRHSLRSSPDG